MLLATKSSDFDKVIRTFINSIQRNTITLSKELTMPAEFRLLNDRVVTNIYREPLQANEVEQMVNQLSNYVEQSSQPVLAIADFSEVKHFPSSLMTMALRRNTANPVRNPKIETLMVIADSAFLESLVSAISKITRVRKIILVRTRAEGDREIAAFVAKAVA
jgi:hypothetical protein